MTSLVFRIVEDLDGFEDGLGEFAVVQERPEDLPLLVEFERNASEGCGCPADGVGVRA
ncbi:MAG: hypothetical protein RLN76_06325 [Phycisphaeraceae bacterium]